VDLELPVAIGLETFDLGDEIAGGRHARSARVVDTTYFGNVLRCRASTSPGSVTCGQYDASIS
jgi:hypothetical protein